MAARLLSHFSQKKREVGHRVLFSSPLTTGIFTSSAISFTARNSSLSFSFLIRSRASSHYVNERKTSGEYRTGGRTEGNVHENLEQVVGGLSMGGVCGGGVGGGDGAKAQD